MASIRRNNDLDDFISNGQQPIMRHLSPRNVYHEQPLRHVQPNRIIQTRRPMISPLRSPKLQQAQVRAPRVQDRRQLMCRNQKHPGKKAQYYVRNENEDVPSCGICATFAASKGFIVNRIGNNVAMPLTSKKKVKSLPSFPQYHTNRRYQQLLHLLKNIMTLEEQFKKKEPKYVAQKIQEQEKILNEFYNAAGQIVERMRECHLQQVRLEWNKTQQLANIMYDDLKVHMDDLNDAWDDIEETLQDIVEQVDNTPYQQCMREYCNSVQLFSNKLEQSENASLSVEYSVPLLQEKLSILEDSIGKLWQIEEPKRVQSKKIVQQRSPSPNIIRNVHDLLPKTKNHRQEEPTQTAFRNLFPDDEGAPQASPQFKAF